MLGMERGRHLLPRAWGLAVVLASLPWLGVVGGWALDRLLDSFPLLLVIGGLTGVCVALACAYVATRSALGPRRADAGAPRPSRASARAVTAARGPTEHGSNVLVVEPDEELLARVSRRLHEAGLRVAAVPSGKLALRVLDRDGAPDLVLADLVLPDMSARSLVTALRARAHAHLPVGYLSREPVTVGRDGGEPVLGRPFATDRLIALVDETFLGWVPPAIHGS
jgi:CheY-like chemotaxis protein